MKIKIIHEYKDYHSRPGGIIDTVYIENDPEKIKSYVLDKFHRPKSLDEEEKINLERFINGKSSYLDGDHTDFFTRVTKEEELAEAADNFNYEIERINRVYE
jgi:hypothetical protein